MSNLSAAPHLLDPKDVIPYQPWAEARAAFNYRFSDKDRYDPAGNCRLRAYRG